MADIIMEWALAIFSCGILLVILVAVFTPIVMLVLELCGGKRNEKGF